MVGEFDVIVLGGGSAGGLVAPEVVAGAAAVGPYAEEWMAEAALAIRAELPVSMLADAVHTYPAYGEATGHAARELASGTPEGDRISDERERSGGTGT